jgi:non-ribosomal peptide synthetase component F
VPEPRELPVQYADYAIWRSSQQANAPADAAASYWDRQLAEWPRLELPANYGGSGDEEYSREAAAVPFTLSPDEQAAVALVCRHHKLSRLMTIAAACQLMLADWLGADDLAIGVSIPDREERVLESLLGSFTMMVPIRTRIDTASPVAALLQEVRRTALDAWADGGLAFNRALLESPTATLSVVRSLPMHLVFDRPGPALRPIAGMSVARLPMRPPARRGSLELVMVGGGSRTTGECRYDPASFAASSVERRLAKVWQILTCISRDPDQSVRDLLQQIGDAPDAPFAAFSSPIDCLLT